MNFVFIMRNFSRGVIQYEEKEQKPIKVSVY
jgi:hypothetical protein